MTSPEPVTEAGRRFIDGGDMKASTVLDAVLAIEAEAVATRLAALRAAIEGLTTYPGVTYQWPWDTVKGGPMMENRVAVDRAAVLALIEGTPDPGVGAAAWDRIAKVLEHIEPWASGPVIAKHVGMVAAALTKPEATR